MAFELDLYALLAVLFPKRQPRSCFAHPLLERKIDVYLLPLISQYLTSLTGL